MAELTDEALLSTQTAAVHVGTGKLDHFGEEGSQLAIYYLYREMTRKEDKMSEGARNRQSRNGTRTQYIQSYQENTMLMIYP